MGTVQEVDPPPAFSGSRAGLAVAKVLGIGVF
jgi:hypothetical protein